MDKDFISKQKTRASLIISVFITGVIIFGVGYYTGSRGSIVSAETLGSSKANVDLTSFWRVWRLIDEKSPNAKESTTEKRLYGAIQGLASSLGDPYTVFFPPEENKAFSETISGEFGGIGMEVGIKDGLLTVVSPLKDTPAYKIGIKSGDIVFKIDDTFTKDLSVDNAIKLIRGKKGTEVKLTIIRKDVKEPIEFKVVRDTIVVPVVESKDKEGVHIIHVYTFSENVEAKFRTALRQFYVSGNKKLIIDLRGNPGGYLESAIDMVSWFLPSGEIVVKEDFGNNKEQKIHTSKGYNVFGNDYKIAILVDGGSASASEIFAGAMQDHKKAILVGRKTFGKGSVQEVIPITSDTSLKITIAKWFTPNGVSISKNGLNPDVDVPVTEEDVLAGKDVQMEKAISVLNN